MLRFNRNRLIGTFAVVLLLYILLSHSSSPGSDFRKTTEAGLSRKAHLTKQGKEYLSDAQITAEAQKGLQDVLDKHHDALAADNVAEVAQSIPSTDEADVNVESIASALKAIGYGKETKEYEDVSVAGRKIMQKPKDPGMKEQPKYTIPQSPDLGAGEERAYNGAKVEKVVDMGKEAAREQLQQFLKRSPIVIFSKSQCPYSRRAKTLLLETYNIRPAPFVVELDLMTDQAPRSPDSDEPLMTQGRALQNLLHELTGRKTVPNVMVAAHSIGGSDDVAMMDKEGRLVEEIRKLAGVRVQIERRGEAGDQ